MSSQQKLTALRDAGELVLSGKQWGGRGRSVATLGGRRFAHTGRKFSKVLVKYLDQAYTKLPEQGLIIGDLVGDDGEENVKPSRSQRVKRREGLTKNQRAVRAKITEPAKRSRNEYVHRIDERLKALNRGELSINSSST